jgi:hypothetical protein
VRDLRFAIIGFLSGCLWGGIALLIIGPHERIARGGALVSPLIGLLVGWIVARVRPERGVARVAFSLLSLYVAVALFGLACGVFDFATGQNAGPGWHRDAGGTVIQAALGMIWGLTFTGWIVVLGPLAYFNHSLIWKLGGPRSRDMGGE